METLFYVHLVISAVLLAGLAVATVLEVRKVGKATVQDVISVAGLAFGFVLPVLNVVLGMLVAYVLCDAWLEKNRHRVIYRRKESEYEE